MSAMYAYYTERLQQGKCSFLFLVIMNLFLMSAIILWTVLGTIFILPLVYLFFKLTAGKSTQWIIRWCVWCYGRVWQFFSRPFVKFEPPQFHMSQFSTPGIVVVNHRSFFDTYCMNMLPVPDLCFAVRDWPFKIPVYNFFMTKGAYINTEKFSWDNCLDHARETISRGGFVVFFPEGHRSKTGQMTKFYSGAFKMAVETGAPVIPVCLTGTEDLLPPDRKYMAPAQIKMKVLDPVHPDSFQGEIKHIEMKKQIKQLMAAELAAMDGYTDPEA